MEFDERISGALTRAAAGVEPSIPDSLGAVLRRARRRTVIQRVTIAGAVVAALAVVLGAGQMLGLLGDRRDVRPARVPTTDVQSASAFTVTATHTAQSMGLQRLLGMAIALDGTLYLTDASQVVVHVRADGHVLNRWGGPGTAAGHFRLEGGAIAVGSDGRVYVADTGNFRVQVFSPSGKHLASFGRFGNGPGQFLWPFDIAVDTAGGIWVADDRAATLTKLTPSGRQAWRLGDPGTTPPHLVGHDHFAQFDRRGRLVLANDDSGFVVYVDSSGQEVAAFGHASSGDPGVPGAPPGHPFPDGACDVTIDPAGLTYVSSCQDAAEPGRTTSIFDSQRRPVGVWQSPLTRSPRFAPDGSILGIGRDGSLLVLSRTSR
jgi:DNA-binding beta-propeller fold protein YncE